MRTRWMKPLLSIAVTTALLFALACSSNDSKGTPTPAAQSSPAGGATPSATAAPSGPRLADLLLVYVDARLPQQRSLYVASAEGANPRLVTNLAAGASVLDVQGKLAAVRDGSQISVVDLVSGQTKSVPAPAGTTFVRFFDEKTLLYVQRTGCGPEPMKGTLFKLDLATMQSSQVLTTSDTAGFSIAGVDPKAGVVALAPRGCDVSTTSLRLYKLADGSLIRDVPTKGCGAIYASLTLNLAFASWTSCNPNAESRG